MTEETLKPDMQLFIRYGYLLGDSNAQRAGFFVPCEIGVLPGICRASEAKDGLKKSTD